MFWSFQRQFFLSLHSLCICSKCHFMVWCWPNLLWEPLYHMCEYPFNLFLVFLVMLKLPTLYCVGADYQEEDLGLIQKWHHPPSHHSPGEGPAQVWPPIWMLYRHGTGKNCVNTIMWHTTQWWCIISIWGQQCQWLSLGLFALSNKLNCEYFLSLFKFLCSSWHCLFS